MSSLSQKADRLIVKPDGVSERKYRLGEGKTYDIIKVILYADSLSRKCTEKFSKEFEKWNTEDALFRLWRFVRTKIRYKADSRGHERIKSPSKTWQDRYGDCKSMSIFIGSVLQNLGIPYSYRFVSYADNKDIGHVYVIAHTNKGEVILDAVYDKFNKEEKYAYKKDIKGMTQISYVHGITRSSVGAAAPLDSVLAPPQDAKRIDDSPKRAAPSRLFDFPSLTEGELRLQLLDRKLEILQSYYGDPTGEIARGRTMILNTLFKGLHRAAPLTGQIPKSLQVVAQSISQARRLSATAVKAKSQAQQVAIGALVRGENCLEKYGTLVETTPGDFEYEISPANQAAYQECVTLQRNRDLLNKYYEKSAHHVMYEFIDNANAQNNVVATKTVLHKTAVGEIARLTGISRENMRAFTEVSIMAHNSTNRNIGPRDPKASIELLKASAQFDNLPSVSGIGEPLTIAAITALVGLLLKAVTTVVAMIQSNRQIAQANIRGYGTPDFSADTVDWGAVPGQGGNFQSNLSQYAPLLLGGFGAFLLLNE